MRLGIKLSWIFLWVNLSVGLAQFPGGIGSGGSSSPSPQSEVEADTIDVDYFFSENIGLIYSFSDSLFNNRFEQYDPARRREVDHVQLGNLGTAILPQLYENRGYKGFDIGFHQYDLYNIHHEELRFYKIEKPFSDLYFTQGPTQSDTYFKGRFTRNFDEGLNFSVDFKRMNNVGQFKSQAVINTALAMGFWYRHKGGKYNAFMTYVSNTNDVEDNGGVDMESLTTADIDRVFNIPVFLRTANTYYLTREYAYTHQYNLFGKPIPSSPSKNILSQPPPPPGVLGIPDSLSEKPMVLPVEKDTTEQVVTPPVTTSSNGRSFILSHDLIYKTKSHKFYDSSPMADTVYYEHLLVDTRGLRYFIEDKSIENTFAISTSKSGVQSQRDLLKVSLEHQLHFLHQEPRDSTINQLILGGQWNFAPSEGLKVQTHLSYNLWDNFGDYRLGGDLYLDLKGAGIFKASATSSLYSPSLVQQQMFITERQLWKNNFDKTLETNLSATYALPKLGFSATGQYHLLNNLIYFDTLAFPQQISSPVNVLQLIVNQNFKVGKIHLDNTVALQTTTEDVIRVPSVFSKHSLYFEGKIFKNIMLFKLGMDIRLLQSYYANYYQPLIGQFHLQDDQELEFYPVVDAYASFKVQTFRFFIKTENLTQLITDDLYYPVAGYAQPYMTIKFGVSWQLLN